MLSRGRNVLKAAGGTAMELPGIIMWRVRREAPCYGSSVKDVVVRVGTRMAFLPSTAMDDGRLFSTSP